MLNMIGEVKISTLFILSFSILSPLHYPSIYYMMKIILIQILTYVSKLIVDLGLCIDLTEIQFLRHKCAGTCEFIAPELFEGVNVGPWCDIWSLGITLLEMANGEPPISSALKSMILASSNHFGSARSLLKNPDDWSKEFISFIEQCLIFDYSKRPTAESLLQVRYLLLRLLYY